MAMSGTYVAEVPLKGSARDHYKRWKSENHLFSEAAGHHIQDLEVHDDWNSHGAVNSWDYTCDGKQEVFKEKREADDEKMVMKVIGLEGHVMEQFKVYDVTFQFISESEEGCFCKITLSWEKRNEDSPDPINYMNFVKSLVVDMDDHVLQGQT